MGMAPVAHVLFTRCVICRVVLIVHLPHRVLTNLDFNQVLQCQSQKLQMVQQGSFRLVEWVSDLRRHVQIYPLITNLYIAMRKICNTPILASD